MKQEEWFGEWFDSPYYHMLYQHRDENEAKVFLKNLIAYLAPEAEATFLDIGCGKGRHAITLNEMGFDVTGIDLSASSIAEASQHANEKLRFYTHDKREPFSHEAYDYVLNLFTSFGFFNTHREHKEAIAAMAENLKKGGRLILDFLNPYVVINELVEQEVKHVDGINFHINRTYDGAFIIKEISFEDDGRPYRFYEKIKAIRRQDFIDYFEAAGLTILTIFGDYELSPYQKDKSDRVIFLAKK